MLLVSQKTNDVGAASGDAATVVRFGGQRRDRDRDVLRR
jgi:hypothetical protein